MANKWAIANGNWSDGSTWNDGVVPTADDYVYANGHTVTMTVVPSIGNGTLSNEECPATNISGGHFVVTGNQTGKVCQCNLKQSSNTSLLQLEVGNGSNITFVGDIRNEDNFAIELIHGNALTLSVVGDVSVGSVGALRLNSTSQPYTITINGNIISRDDEINSLFYETLTRNEIVQNLTINGNATMRTLGKPSATNFTMNGNLNVINDGNIVTTNCVIAGNITYHSLSNHIGLSYQSLNIVNAENFTWKDITMPRSNLFVIVTNAELNNHQQYPQESDVKNGVEYAYGLKEGNYTPNFPQEANVLKDVEYGGDKVGTLEVIALSGATATADNISVVNLTEQEVERVKNCATVSTVQKCFEDFKEE